MENGSLLFLCLLVGAANLILLIRVLWGSPGPRSARQEFSFRHEFTHHFRGPGADAAADPHGSAVDAAPNVEAEVDPEPGERGAGDPIVVEKLREVGFTVHLTSEGETLEPEPSRLGEILLMPSPDDEPPCPNCGIQMFDFHEVVDRGASRDGLDTAWEQFGIVCVACGYFRRHDEDLLEPRGVFRYGPEDEGDLILFLEEFPAEAVNGKVRNAYRQALAELERSLMARVFAVRQQIANADLAVREAEERESEAMKEEE